VLRHGADTAPGAALFTLRGNGDVELFMADNLASDRDGQPVPLAADAAAAPMTQLAPGAQRARMLPLAAADLPPDVRALPASRVARELPPVAGARPWDRDAVDTRLLRELAAGAAKLIDSELEAGGYARQAPSSRAFNPQDWNLDDMSPKAGWGAIGQLSQPAPRNGA